MERDKSKTFMLLLLEFSYGQETMCFGECFIAVKRYHDCGNAHRGKHLPVTCLVVQRFSPLSSWQEAW